MGGRGQATKYGQGNMSGDKRNLTFYDHTDKYKGMPLHEFENKIRDRKHEWIGLTDENGNIVIAGTSHNSGSVAIPKNHPDFNKARTLTHNHPYDSERPIGATFSSADIKVHATFNNLFTQTRAVSGGKNENTYIIKSKSGAKQSPQKLYKYAQSMTQSKLNTIMDKSISKAKKKFDAKGKKMTTAQMNQIGLGSIKKVWKNEKINMFGYDYIEVKKARW